MKILYPCFRTDGSALLSMCMSLLCNYGYMRVHSPHQGHQVSTDQIAPHMDLK